jgi:hypothetical protein
MSRHWGCDYGKNCHQPCAPWSSAADENSLGNLAVVGNNTFHQATGTVAGRLIKQPIGKQ